MVAEPDHKRKNALEYKRLISKDCLECQDHLYGICDIHSAELARAIKHFGSGIPIHFVKELNNSIIEKDCIEYDLISDSMSPPFKGYRDLFIPYINSLSGKVLEDSLSFVFYSFNGAGKTHTAIHILSEGLKQGLTCQYVIFKDLMNIYNRSEFAREEESEDSYKMIMYSDILVIDEVGKESTVTPNILGAFENIIKHRVSMSKATIMITNLNFPDPKLGFLARYGSSIYNSILQNYRVITFSKEGNFRGRLRKRWEI